MSNRAFLLLKPPQENDKNESSADKFFSQLSEILKGEKIPISAEILVLDKYLWFFLTCPQRLKDLIKGQLYSYYPQTEINEVKDYTEKVLAVKKGSFACGCELYFDYPELSPLLNYKELEKNPLISLCGVASSFIKGESGLIQMVLKAPKKEGFLHRLSKKQQNSSNYPGNEESWRLQQEKKEGPYFYTTIRFLCLGSDLSRIKLNLSAMVNVYKKSLERRGLQKLKDSRIINLRKLFSNYQKREIGTKLTYPKKHALKFSSAELATIFHLPYEAENISQLIEFSSKKAPPPLNLPSGKKDTTMFGVSNFQDRKIEFGIKKEDRRRHLYIIGKTGMGKSKMLELLIKSDIEKNHGVILLDPHGDLLKNVCNYIPQERRKDVIYFNPADTEYPIGFNPLANVNSFEEKQNIVNGFVSIFKKFFGLNWNERFEHVLRYTTLALLDSPRANILGIPRMLTDNLFRQKVISYIKDPLVKKFWSTEFASWNEQFAGEAIVPIINKIGQFTANPAIRHIIGQTESAFSLSDIMDNGKILLANLSIGSLGEENSALLGSMLVTKIWQAAIARADTPEEKRKDVYLYVDEFQNFATSAFANILSEARKYRLNLTVAHQYMQQLPHEVLSTIFGNVGNIVSFRVGGEDALILQKEFEPVFSVNDFLNLDMQNFFIKMSIAGQVAKPFSAQSIYLPKAEQEQSHIIAEDSRRSFAKSKKEVEKEIEDWEKGENILSNKVEQEPYFPEPIV